MENSSVEGRRFRDYGYSRGSRRAEDMVGAYSDWDRSGGGCCCGGGYGGGGGGSDVSSLFSDGTLFALLAGAALAFYILYTTVTMAADAGRRRKKRSSKGKKKDIEPEDDFFDFESLIWEGLEEFEEKIDRIAEGEDGGDENSWINKIYNQFSFFNEVDETPTNEDMDGLEPPILDETWGLGDRLGKNTTAANTTISEPIEINEEESKRSKRSIDEDNSDDIEDIEEENTEEKCRVDMWRCLSNVIEGGLHYIDKPEGLMGLAKKTMFKVAFHGGMSNVWNGLMTIPEARRIKKCMTEHTDCVSYEILRREAQATLDPSDPSYTMYETKEKKTTESEEKTLEMTKRKRLIINPNALPEDLSDGSVAYDEDLEEYNEI